MYGDAVLNHKCQRLTIKPLSPYAYGSNGFEKLKVVLIPKTEIFNRNHIKFVGISKFIIENKINVCLERKETVSK